MVLMKAKRCVIVVVGVDGFSTKVYHGLHTDNALLRPSIRRRQSGASIQGGTSGQKARQTIRKGLRICLASHQST